MEIALKNVWYIQDILLKTSIYNFIFYHWCYFAYVNCVLLLSSELSMVTGPGPTSFKNLLISIVAPLAEKLYYINIYYN